MKRMKTLKRWLILIPIVLVACGKEQDMAEPPIEKVPNYTTVKAVFKGGDGMEEAVSLHRLLDTADNGLPEILVASLRPNATYDVELYFLDESIVPMDSLNKSIITDNDKYQVFFDFEPRLGIAESYADADIHGNPLGLRLQVVTDSIGAPEMLVTLVSEPDKDSVRAGNGDMNSAGGEIVKQVSLQLSIE